MLDRGDHNGCKEIKRHNNQSHTETACGQRHKTLQVVQRKDWFRHNGSTVQGYRRHGGG